VFACFFCTDFSLRRFYLWQEQQIRKDLQKPTAEPARHFDVRVDKSLILKLVDQIRARNQSLRGIGDNLLGVAVLGEVANTIPANVRLLSINARLGTAAQPAPGGKPDTSKKVLVLDGVIFGDRATLEADLAAYLLTLKNSPLFKQPTISKKSMETMDN
jgi:Tfp pilus assembly protein PilN